MPVIVSSAMLHTDFSMPMFRPFVPKLIQPWLYIAMVVCIQFSGGVYLGALSAVRGTTNLMIEDLLMLLYAGLAGMAVYFPLLFRTKFRFTNQQLLCVSAIVIAVCNFLTMHTSNMAVLLPICFVAGMAKIQGTFECMSNIQLWITPKRDFGVFFPVLHIVLLTAITGSAWLSAAVAFRWSWQMMHVLTIATMAFVVLTQLLLCRPFCPMPQRIPLHGIDFLTGLIISVLMLMVCYLFVYGDYLMWSDSLRWRLVLACALVVAAVLMWRLRACRKPYIDLQIFRYKNVVPILLVTAVAEILLGAEHTLEEIFYAEVVDLPEHIKSEHGLWALCGIYGGVLITLWWLGHKKWKVWRLLAFGFGCLLAYAACMYFFIDVNAPIEQYRVAVILRGCACAVLSISLMWSLHESIPDLEHFFMGLFVFNILHMYLAGAAGNAFYTNMFSHLLADNMSRYGVYLVPTRIDAYHLFATHFIDTVFLKSMMSVTLKQIYGIVVWLSAVTAVVFLLLDIPRVRTGVRKVPYWPVYGIDYLARLKR